MVRPPDGWFRASTQKSAANPVPHNRWSDVIAQLTIAPAEHRGRVTSELYVHEGLLVRGSLGGSARPPMSLLALRGNLEPPGNGTRSRVPRAAGTVPVE